MKKYVLAASLAVLSVSVVAQDPGDLNISFGQNGHQVFDISNTNPDFPAAVAVQADGKVVLATNSNDAGNRNFEVTRLNPDGSLDNSFDLDGKKTIDVDTYDDAYDVAILSNGKIVVVGVTKALPGGAEDGVAIMLNSDGSLDNSFGNQGVVQMDQTAGEVDVWTNVEEIANGNIVIGGTLEAGGKKYFSIRSLTPTGALNPAFNSSVDFIELPNVGNTLSTSMTLGPNGEILVAGYALDGIQYKNVICAWNANGSKNFNFFSTAYRMFHLVSGELNAIFDIAYDKNGDIVGLGSAGTANAYDLLMFRLDPSGYNDTSFSQDGWTRSDLSLGASDEMIGLHVLPNNHYLTVGRLRGAEIDIQLAVFDEKGDLDPDFGTNGKVVSDLGYGNHEVWGSDLHDGKLYLTAQVQGNTSQDILVASYYIYNTIGVDEEISHYYLDVFPNPAVDHISIDITHLDVDRVEILDMTGKVIHSEDLETTSSIIDLEVGHWPSGVYMLRLKGNNGLHTNRFVIQ